VAIWRVGWSQGDKRPLASLDRELPNQVTCVK
jgi:hypothetical protein